jgi:mannose-6-phosphate isomerase-like protein (cupin superfamily)
LTEAGRIVGSEGISSFVTPQDEDLVVYARGDTPGENYDLLKFTIPQDPGVVPLHVHHDNDEGFYVLEGELVIQIGDERHQLTPGSYAFGPRGVPHAYRNVGDGPAEILVIYRPGNFVSMTEELAGISPLDLEDDSDVARVIPIFASCRLEMVGHPLGGD